MNISSHRLNLLLAGAIFLILYLPVMGRPYSYSELRVTSYFHKVSSQNNFLLYEIGKDERLSQWDEYKKDYLKLYPPLVISFYIIWRLLTFEDEILMRLPLLLFILWSFYELFQTMSLLWGKEESSLFLLFSILLPWWYTHGTSITPPSFGLFMGLVSTSLFLRHLKEEKNLSIKFHVVTILGLVTLYQYSLILLAQILVFLFVKNRKQYLLSASIYSVILASIWIFYFAHPVPYMNNPLAFFWAKREPNDFLKLIQVFLTGGAGA